MSTQNQTARRARGIIVFAIIGVLLGLVAARLVSHVLAYGDGTIMGLAPAFSNITTVIPRSPFAIDFTKLPVLAAFFGTIGLLAFVAIVSTMRGEKLENEDTGAEHGDDRLATVKEMHAFEDKKHFCNNVLYSENCHLAMKPHDKHTKEVLDGRNLNCITLGISGLGKTYNLVWPDLMQSVGDALPPMRVGIANIPEHIKLTRAHKTLNWALATAKGDASGKAAAATPLPSEKKKVKKEKQKEEKAKADAERESALFNRFSALRSSYIDTVGKKESKREQKARALASITGGYDVFNTDPKGDNVRDVGPLFEAAGYNIKVIDTIDFKNGLHVNPLAYIKTHQVDAKAAEETRVRVSVLAPGSLDENEDPVLVNLFEEGDDAGLAPGMSVSKSFKGADKLSAAAGFSFWSAEASYNLTTKKWKGSEVGEVVPADELDDAIDEVTEAINASAEVNPELEARLDALLRQQDMMAIHNTMGSSTVDSGGDATSARTAGKGCKRVAEAVAAQTYRYSSGVIDIKFKNLSPFKMNADVIIELDESLVVDAAVVVTDGMMEWARDDDGNPCADGTHTWKIGGLVPKKLAHHSARIKAQEKVLQAEHIDEESLVAEASELIRARKLMEEQAEVAAHLVLSVHVKSETVPDGVDLTKIVDCLVTNLRGTDNKSNGSEDPFWEDTKRLCFMSLVALLFEKYQPQYRTLPEVMRLLNMALPDSGDLNDPSPLSLIMDEWETGKSRDMGGDTGGAGGYAVKREKWKKASNVPHDRNASMALHCFHAFTSGAPETVQSVIISCQACLVNLISEDVKEFLAYDELELDTLGDPDQKQVIFCVTKDTNSPFDFITALIVYLAIDLAQDKAYKVYGGKLPRHVRFVLDEAANIGKIPILIRALAVVRSRNISISMYLQSKAQLALVYGEKEANVIFDNCTTIVFLGAQTEETVEEMSKKVGTETVQSRRFQRSFNSNSILSGSVSESITSNERRVVSASKMGHLEKGYLMLFIFNSYAIYDHKFKTRKHPYYAYINPGDERSWTEPLCRVSGRFDYQEYRRRREVVDLG